MLQRAASNAYSWWWASHVRTKQSKWLEQNLQDVEEKVSAVLKLIQEDGDSFAKRAEMYYKKRPELINFVEESYRAYRALAERYDHISKELQNANNTLASAFPDQFQFTMDDDDDDEFGPPKIPRRPIHLQQHNPNIPQAPKQFPTRNIKAIIALAAPKGKQLPPKKTVGKLVNKTNNAPKSGLTKAQAIEEIDKLQKTILTKQTEKEFTKSSYEKGVAKYWHIEEDITQMQQKISKLQDEFGVGKAIEDNEARTLMAEAALKSCQETLAQLQEKQDRSALEAKAERKKIKEARKKLLSLKGEFLGGGDGIQIDQSEPPERGQEATTEMEERLASFDDGGGEDGSSQTKKLEMLRDKLKEHFEMNSSLSVSEMAEKIDELVNKVINLETAVSSQTALIQRLRSETDDLQAQIKTLEDDKADLIDGKNNLTDQLKEMEDRLKGLQDLDHNVERRNSSLQAQFKEANQDLDDISEKLPNVKLDEELEDSQKGEDSVSQASGAHELKKENDGRNRKDNGTEGSIPSLLPQGEGEAISIKEHRKPINNLPEKSHKDKEKGEDKRDSPLISDESHVVSITSQHKQETSPESLTYSRATELQIEEKKAKQEEENEPNWQQPSMNGLEEKEKVPLNEYNLILQNYKEVKKKLNDLENKNLKELNELRTLNAKKDDEILSLHEKLIHLQKKLDEYKNMSKVKEDQSSDSMATPETDDEDIKFIVVDQARVISPVEEKLRADIDEILEENLDFWMRFSTSFSQIQKFQDEIKDLQKELEKIEEKKKEGSSTGRTLKSDARPIYKHLKEIQTDLALWVGKSVSLKDELQRRFTQLCNMQEDITRALNDGAIDDEMKFTSYQAAKFQGEVLNMKQENNKVADELQAGLDQVTTLQVDVERTITRLSEKLGISGSKSQSQMQLSGVQGQVPLRSFIFGVKPKKQKQSILSCVHPALRKYQQLKS